MDKKKVKNYGNRIFAERLRTLMGKRNVGLAEIAAATNCAVSTASTWKRGRLPRHEDTLAKIAKFLGSTPQWLSGVNAESPVFSNEAAPKKTESDAEFRRAKILALVNSAMNTATGSEGGLRKFESRLRGFFRKYSY